MRTLKKQFSSSQILSHHRISIIIHRRLQIEYTVVIIQYLLHKPEPSGPDRASVYFGFGTERLLV